MEHLDPLNCLESPRTPLHNLLERPHGFVKLNEIIKYSTMYSKLQRDEQISDLLGHDA